MKHSFKIKKSKYPNPSTLQILNNMRLEKKKKNKTYPFIPNNIFAIILIIIKKKKKKNYFYLLR